MLSSLQNRCPLCPESDKAEVVSRKLLEEPCASIPGARRGREGDSTSVVQTDQSGRGGGTADPLHILGNEVLYSFPPMSLHNFVEPGVRRITYIFLPMLRGNLLEKNGIIIVGVCGDNFSLPLGIQIVKEFCRCFLFCRFRGSKNIRESYIVGTTIGSNSAGVHGNTL